TQAAARPGSGAASTAAKPTDPLVIQVVSIGEGHRQGLMPMNDQPAASTGPGIHQSTGDADQERADAEEEAARAGGDVICHDFRPRGEWRFTGATRIAGSRLARTGVP